MKKLAFSLAAICLAAPVAFAQSETPKTSQTTPAMPTSGETNPGAPVAGKNSFTEAQAKSRIENAGYTDVSGLKLDDQGVWRAMASKDGKQGSVSVDFQGNVVMAK
ncbi:PepSY domain-containing protein [Rhizobium lusitanum]|uniref:PepSY domain-containing protein n=1 Tax=Rhizobium lusitanum TaxID=293958 RepID=A0A6L9UFI6_9HYPH|nr:PepSY domain-containing protein [Rhizobium lusitanum]NEI72897.1 PepSY domain-containing protein [Rhizobium lusitanum]